MKRGLTPPPKRSPKPNACLPSGGTLTPPARRRAARRQAVDRYEAARAAELLEWAEACAEMDAHKERMVAATRARLAEAEAEYAADESRWSVARC